VQQSSEEITDEKETEEKETEEKRRRRLQVLDYTSAVLSCFGFWFAVIYSIIESNPFQKVELWDANLLISHNASFISGLNDFSDTVQDFCPKSDRNLAVMTRKYNEAEYTGTVIFHKGTAASGPLFTHMMPWVCLYFILIISCWFQLLRGLQFRNYNPKKPDFWRWVEYALTSPLQIYLVAYSVTIVDRVSIFNLMGLQAALVLIGFMNEKHINKIWKAYERSGKTSINLTKGYYSGKSLISGVRLLFLMFMSWIFFFIIWSSIITRFNTQVDNGNDCLFQDKMPIYVVYLVWSQAVLFGTFGLVQTFQVLIMLSPSTFFNTKEDMWFTVTYCYSILSVVSKTVLEGLFIAVVSFQSTTIT
jgi:hypothetical protein